MSDLAHSINEIGEGFRRAGQAILRSVPSDRERARVERIRLGIVEAEERRRERWRQIVADARLRRVRKALSAARREGYP